MNNRCVERSEGNPTLKSEDDPRIRKAMEKADLLIIRLKELGFAISEARAAYFGGEINDQARGRLEALEKEAGLVHQEFALAVSEAQTLAGIPEELLRTIELADVAPDTVHRVARNTLTEDNVPSSEWVEDTLPNALERILAVVDHAWLREQRKIPCRLDRELLETPISLVRGVRLESEHPAIHRFAQAISVCEDFLDNRDETDIFAAALLVPQMAALGMRLPYLDNTTGQTLERIEGLWKGPSEEVDSVVFELLVAASSVARGQSVEFLRADPKGRSKTPDLRIHDYPFPTVVECKRKRTLTQYEEHEELIMRQLFDNLYAKARKRGLWGIFDLELDVAADKAPFREIVECSVRQYLVPQPAKATQYGWGSVAFRELPRTLAGPPARLYGPAFLKAIFGWNTDLPTHDGILCKVTRPDGQFVDSVKEPVALYWKNVSREAIKKKSWSPMDLFNEAIQQIPLGQLGVIYVCYQEGGREEIADLRTDSLQTRIAEVTHSAGIRVPISFLDRLYPRPLADGKPDLIESSLRLLNGLYGDPTFFADFPATVFTRLG